MNGPAQEPKKPSRREMTLMALAALALCLLLALAGLYLPSPYSAPAPSAPVAAGETPAAPGE